MDKRQLKIRLYASMRAERQLRMDGEEAMAALMAREQVLLRGWLTRLYPEAEQPTYSCCGAPYNEDYGQYCPSCS